MKKSVPYNTKLPVILTIRARDIIRDNTFVDPDFAKLGIVEGKDIRLMMSLDEIEEVLGHVAFETNHTSNKLLQKQLDKICDKLQFILDRYVAQNNETNGHACE